MKKMVLFCVFLCLPFFSAFAEEQERGAFFQVVKSELDLKPEMVESSELIYDELNDAYKLRLMLTPEGVNQFNGLILNSYKMGMNIFVNNEPISLSIVLVMHELRNNVIDIMSSNQEALKKFQSYLTKK